MRLRALILVASLTLAVLLAAPGSARSSSSEGSVQAIVYVFGPYASQALRVARCESGLSIWAHNGQYLGLFQMGSSERAHYGHAWNAWAQAVSAYRYFIASGKDWSPWACRP